MAVAKELGIRRILVPRSPATFSAFGSLVADIQLTRSRSLIRPLAEEGVLELMTEGFEQLEKETLEPASRIGGRLCRRLCRAHRYHAVHRSG